MTFVVSSSQDRAHLAQPVLAARSGRAKRAVIEAIAAVVALNVVATLAVAAVGGRGVAFSVLGSLAVGSVVGYRRFTRLGLVVWLRKFHPSQGNRIRFHTALGAASTGLLSPMTIQDASFSTSYVAGLYRRIALYPLAMLIWMLGLILLVIPAVLIGEAVFVVVLVAWTVAVGIGIHRFVGRSGHTVVRGDAGRAEAGARLRALAGGRPSLGPSVEVLKCDDDIWRQVVDDALREAKVAIVDVSEPSEHVAWELQRALEHLGEDHVIPTAAAGANLDHVAGDFGIDADWIGRNLLTYPAEQTGPGPGRAKQYRELASQIRVELAARLA